MRYEDQHFATEATIQFWARKRYWTIMEAGYLFAELDPVRAAQRRVSSSHNLMEDPPFRLAELLKQELDA